MFIFDLDKLLQIANEDDYKGILQRSSPKILREYYDLLGKTSDVELNLFANTYDRRKDVKEILEILKLHPKSKKSILFF